MNRYLLLVLSALSLVAYAAHDRVEAQTPAQTWPQRPVKFIVPLGPGAGADTGARLFAERLSAKWGKPIVVENRPGGDGIVAITALINAHDDHVLLFAPSGAFTIHPLTHDKMPYDPADIIPIARITNTIIGVVAPASLKADSLPDLIALARAAPSSFNWAPSSGLADIVTAGFLKSEGIEAAKIAYRDSIQGVTDTAEGRLQMYVGPLATMRAQIDAKRLRLLALNNQERSSLAPGVPTTAELGYPGLSLEGLVGLFGPREIAAELRDRIAADIRAVADDPAIASRLGATGQVLNFGNPAEFTAAIDDQKARMALAAKSLDLKREP